MSESTYKKMLSFIAERKLLKGAIVGLSRLITGFIYAFYPLYLVYIVFYIGVFPLMDIIVPLVAFVSLSIIRDKLDFKRPYEKYDIVPLISKHTKGKTFPSRHTFSAFMIAFAVLSRFPVPGSVILVMAVVLGILRVICGVHFIRDVLAGFLYAAAFAIIFIFV